MCWEYQKHFKVAITVHSEGKCVFQRFSLQAAADRVIRLVFIIDLKPPLCITLLDILYLLSVCPCFVFFRPLWVHVSEAVENHPQRLEDHCNCC